MQFTREQLYQMVWAEPMRVVAAKHGISDRGLAKMCERLEVPRRGRGYWAKKAAGHNMRKAPLKSARAGTSEGVSLLGVLRSLRKAAKKNATVCLVVSTSAYGGSEVATDLILADLAGRAGWQLRAVEVLRTLNRFGAQQWTEPSHRQALRESLIILDVQS